MERDYDRLENPPDWTRFRYEPPRHHSPENEGEDHRGYTAHDYYRDEHHKGCLADHYARDEYRRGYSPIPHNTDGYRRSQSPARDRRNFQSPNSTDRNGRSKPSFEDEVVQLLRKMDTRLGNAESRLGDLITRMERVETRMERVEAGRRSPSPRRNASDLRCQGCGMSEEIEAPRPVPPDTKPVTEAPTPAQIQEQCGARSEKDGYVALITKGEPSHKGCDVVYQNHLGKVISIQQNDLDLSQAAALNGSGWSKVIKCNESSREKIPWNGLDPPSTVIFINVPVSLHGNNIPWNGLDPPKTAGDSALGWCARTTFCGGLELPMACHFDSFYSDTQNVNWNGLDPPRVALALVGRQLQFC